ncbi:MAG: hypothetical protein ACRC1G_14265 [Bradyrhizobium sp.]|nr:hypothetical protein [Bradyrhizobium sp.]
MFFSFRFFRRAVLSRRAILIAVPLACAAPRLVMAESSAGVAFLEKLSLAPASTPVLTLCHGFGCAYRNQFVITPARLSSIRATLAGARSARDERKALSKIIAWLDREGGKVAGTVNRVAYASLDTKSGPSQMDCIDLTANITELLILLERSKMLRYHGVGEPVSRGAILDGKRPHTTPVIVETRDGSQWSMDSWTRAYGQSPDIMTIAEWRSRY